jgi:DNA invertase Pin-like site-specific DNA recombinase
MRQKVHIPTSVVIGKDSIDIQISISIDDLLNDAVAVPAVKGRKRKLNTENERLLKALISTGSVEYADLADAFGVSRTTFWRYRKRFKSNQSGGGLTN